MCGCPSRRCGCWRPFSKNPADELSGSDVQKRSSLASGTLYPILLRLESAGWFVSRWRLSIL